MNRLSIVIPNYNYEDFVSVAIDSALAVDWPDVEVIVVDDGSTDGSRAAIAAYGDRITAILQDNSGPRVACNRGFEASSGDVVIFLDSDDVLDPTIAREIAAVWRPGISKVQFSMLRIDRDGAPTGTVTPDFGRKAPTPEQVRRWMSTTSAYPTPPGSGNVYSREFLEQLFPLDGRCGDATDSACLAAAPFLGDVITVPKPLVSYRQHGENRSYLLADTTRFTRQVERAHQRYAFSREIAEVDPDDLGPLFRGRPLLQLRVAGRRLRPDDHPIPGDGWWRMLGNSLAAPFAPGPEGIGNRILTSGWCVATLVAPTRIAHRLVGVRYRQRASVAPAPVSV